MKFKSYLVGFTLLLGAYWAHQAQAEVIIDSKIEVLGSAGVSEPTDYFIQIDAYYHRITDCASSDDLFRIIGQAPRIIPQRDEGTIDLEQGATFSCDEYILPEIDGELDDIVYIDFDLNYYFKSGIEDTYYRVSQLDESSDCLLDGFLIELIGVYERFEEDVPPFSEDDKVINLQCGSSVGTAYEIKRFAAGAINLVVLAYNYQQDGVFKTSYLPFQRVDGAVMTSLAQVTALEDKLRAMFNIETPTTRLTQPTVIVGAVWFDMCIERCGESTYVPQHFDSSARAIISDIPDYEGKHLLSGDVRHEWKGGSIKQTFQACENDLLPSLGLKAAATDDWFDQLKDNARRDNDAITGWQLACVGQTAPTFCEISVTKPNLSRIDFNALFDNIDCDTATELHVNFEHDVTISHSSYISIFQAVDVEKIIFKPANDARRQRLTFDFRCVRRSDCTNGRSMPAFRITTPADVIFRDLDVDFTITTSVLNEDELPHVRFTGFDVRQGTDLYLENVSLEQRVINNDQTNRWYTGVFIAPGSTLYCKGCTVDSDWIGLYVYSSNLVATNTDDQEVDIQSGTTGVYLLGNSNFVMKRGVIEADTLIYNGTSSLAYLYEPTLVFTGPVIEPEQAAFRFQTQNFEGSRTLEIRDGTFYGLPPTAGNFTFADFSAADGSAKFSLSGSRTQLYVDFGDGNGDKEIHYRDYGKYFNCSSGGLLTYRGGRCSM